MSEDERQQEEIRQGPPLGNQNARKHGFYSSVLSEEEQKEYERAIEIDGLDEEIAMLRVKIISLLEKDPENIRLITQALNSLVRMIILKYQFDKGDKSGIKEAVANVMNNIAIPAGVVIASHLLK